MSKKVLNYAGRRPMLLALIMATLTLGLLFSGWFTPISIKAQSGGGNPSPNNENTNCPNFTYSTNASCPAITNGEVLAPLTFCVLLGNSLPDPNWATPPGAIPGSVVITTTETCSNIVTSTTNPITYGFSWHYQDPPGKPPTPTTAGTYSATAIGVITSSDTNDCPNPSAPTWGVTWTVIKQVDIIKDTAYNWVPDWAAQLANLGGGVLNCPVTINSITGVDDNQYITFCCSNNAAAVSFDNDKINAGSQQLNVTVGTGSVVSMVETMIDKGLDAADLGSLTSPADTAISTFLGSCNYFNVAAGSLNATAAASFHTVVGYNDSCICSSPDTWFGSESVSFACNIGSLSIPASVLQPIGLNIPINIVGLSANLSFNKTSSVIYIGPATTTYTDTVNTRRVSNIYTLVQVGTFYNDKHYWSGPTDTTTPDTTQICEGHYYP